jgi:hypothetical protein
MSERLAILCCPECKGELELHARILTLSGRTKSGVFYCPRCHDVVGAIRNFKYDFLYFDKAACRQRIKQAAGSLAALRLPWEAAEEVIPFHDSRLRWHGCWEVWDGNYMLSHGRPGDEVVFSGEFTDVSVRLLKHPWSGRARFLLDGKPAGVVDLYQPKWSTIHWFPIANDLRPGRHTVSVIPTGDRNPAALASQVFFHELIITRPAEEGMSAPPLQEVNRVLPVFPAVIELMKQVPEDGLILDCGGGDRILADARYINVDCEQYQLPSVYADVLKLPFKADTFDLVFAQALLEHVPDPFAAVEEIRRVTKPGGTAWAGMAFLQPVHAVPSHYFNATAWGIQELFRNLEVLEVSWFGELSFTIDWLLQAAGVAEQLPAEEYRAIMERIRALDPLVSYQALRNVASGVAVRARKAV